MSSFDAFHLPGVALENLALHDVEFGDVEARVPVLTPAQLEHVIAQIVAARAQTLRHTPVADIVAAIAAAAARITAPDTDDGRAARRLLPRATGYSPEVIEDVLQHMAQDWSASTLHELLRHELGNADLLDSAGPGRGSRVHGPLLGYHIFSGNVPGIAVTSLMRGLLVKSATLGKTASGEPVLPVLFANALAAVAPKLAGCLAVTYWPGGSEALEAVALAAADAVVVYGDARTVESVRSRARPGTRLLVHGPKISFGIVGRDAAPDVAAAVARATAAYDQQGCVSPHAIFVEQGGRPARELAAAVAEELRHIAAALPRRRLSHAEVLAIREQRARVEFRGIGGADADVFGPEDGSYTVLYDDELRLPVSCLNRTLFIIPVAGLEVLPGLLEPHRALLQSVAIAGIDAQRRTAVAEMLSECGVTRITTFDALPWPPMWWHHDGRGPLTELLTYTDFEY